MWLTKLVPCSGWGSFPSISQVKRRVFVSSSNGWYVTSVWLKRYLTTHIGAPSAPMQRSNKQIPLDWHVYLRCLGILQWWCYKSSWTEYLPPLQLSPAAMPCLAPRAAAVCQILGSWFKPVQACFFMPNVNHKLGFIFVCILGLCFQLCLPLPRPSNLNLRVQSSCQLRHWTLQYCIVFKHTRFISRSKLSLKLHSAAYRPCIGYAVAWFPSFVK